MQDNYNNQRDKDNFKDVVGNTLRNFEADPPAGLWNKIEDGLHKRRRRVLLIRTTSIAASLLLLIGLGVTWFTTDLLQSPNRKAISDRTATTKEIRYNPEDSNSHDGTKTPSSDVEKTSIHKIQPSTSIRTEPVNTLQQKNLPKTRRITLPSKDTETDAVVEINRPEADLAIMDPVHTDSVPINTGNDRVMQPIDSIVKGTDLAKVQDENIEPRVEQVEKPQELRLPITPVAVEQQVAGASDPSWSLAMGYSLSSGLDLTQNKNDLTDNGSRYSHDDFTASLANGTSYFEEIENTVHNAPLTLGITIDKRIARRLSIETGITYTRLGFSVKTDDLSSFYRKYRNELYYLGIPVGVRYSFLERKRFELYALQWLVLEKGIAGRWYVDTYNNNKLTETESTNHAIRGIQLSTITGLGGEFRLTGKLYLFGQGGVQVFYLNKTQPYNIRSSHVAWPSFQTGLRIKL